jgi:hypothetical protein
MIENYRTQSVWKHFMRNQNIQRGLDQAGFKSVTFVPSSPTGLSGNTGFGLAWEGTTGRTYQVEQSSDLELWRYSMDGLVVASNNPARWTDSQLAPTHRFYRVFQFGAASE